MNFFDFAFWQQFVSNALATFLGVLIGIPVALWLSSYQERRNETESRIKILRLLYKELLTNREHLLLWNESQDKLKDASILHMFLRNESWRAFSDGGEIYMD